MTVPTVRLQFIKRLNKYATEKPYWLFVGRPDHAADANVTNVEMQSVADIPLVDVRGHEECYDLETHGFQFVREELAFTKFSDPGLIEAVYIPQVQELISSMIPGATRVLVFDWRIRQEVMAEDLDTLVSPAQIQDQSFVLAPSQSVHTDCTEFTLRKRVKLHFPDEASALLEQRVQMINFWRPINGVVKNWPLIVCDGRTSPLKNLVAVDQVGRRFVGDIYYAVYDPSYKWHYQSDMGVHDGVLFKSWDTADEVPSRVCLHSSSALPEAMLPQVYEPRHSIETRALVFLPRVETNKNSDKDKQ